MGKKRRMPKVMLTLEQQLAAMPARPTPPDPREPWMVDVAGQVAWDNKRAELQRAIRHRDAKRLSDPGRDASGHFSVSPYRSRGHHVEDAPKELRSSPDSQFPKRIATQRAIDRLKALGTISDAEWKAANMMWQVWCSAETGDRLVAAYEPVTVHASPDTGRLVARRLDAAMVYLDMIGIIPYRCRGVVIHVVINDWELSDWNRTHGFGSRHSRRLGGARLSQGLSALVAHLGY